MRRDSMTEKKIRKEEFIYLYNKKVRIDKLIESFVVIPAKEIARYLRNKEIYLPSYVHKALIKKNIAPIIANADNDDKFSDEMKHRLKWFDQFTIFQLERLTESYRISINVSEYKRDFWDVLIRNRTELGINNLEFIKLQNLTMKYQRNKQETYEELVEQMVQVFFEPNEYFEGVPIEEAKEVLVNSTTLTDIRELGKKYDIEIPRRINKKQLVEILAIKLNLNEKETDDIMKKSILELERLAKEKKVNVSIELKKIDMIEFILLKKAPPIVPIHEESARIFEGINLEDYLYDAKFEEIAHRFNQQKKKKRNMVRNVVISIIIVVAAAIVVLLNV